MCVRVFVRERFCGEPPEDNPPPGKKKVIKRRRAIGASGQTKANFGRKSTSEESRWTVFLPGLFRKVCLYVRVKIDRNLGIYSGIRIDPVKQDVTERNPTETVTLPSDPRLHSTNRSQV